MPIENRNLTKGTKLTGRYHKQSYSCEVVEDAEGKLLYRLEDGREFKSLSAAGKTITGHACDGWVFWSTQTEESAPKREAENQTQTAPKSEITAADASQRTEPEPTKDASKTNSKKTGVFLVPNQKGVPEGQIRWFCRECGKSFIASAVEIPGVCPAKHQTK
jgi:rubrerythrin